MQKRLFHESYRGSTNAPLCSWHSALGNKSSTQLPSTFRPQMFSINEQKSSLVLHFIKGQPVITTEFGALNETPEHTPQTLILITTSAMERQSVSTSHKCSHLKINLSMWLRLCHFRLLTKSSTHLIHSGSNMRDHLILRTDSVTFTLVRREFIFYF